MSFYFQRVKAQLLQASSARAVSSDESTAELRNGLILEFGLDSQDSHDAAEYFWPGYSVTADRIEEREGEHPGIKANVALSSPAMTFVIYDAIGVRKIFAFQNASVAGTVSFSIGRGGNSKMRLKVSCKMSRQDMGNLHTYLGSDVVVSAAETQTTMFDGEPWRDEIREAEKYMSGEAMRADRNAAGLSRKALADKLGLSEKSIGRYENDERKIPDDVAAVIRSLADDAPTETESSQ